MKAKVFINKLYYGLIISGTALIAGLWIYIGASSHSPQSPFFTEDESLVRLIPRTSEEINSKVLSDCANFLIPNVQEHLDLFFITCMDYCLETKGCQSSAGEICREKVYLLEDESRKFYYECVFMKNAF